MQVLSKPLDVTYSSNITTGGIYLYDHTTFGVILLWDSLPFTNFPQTFMKFGAADYTTLPKNKKLVFSFLRHCKWIFGLLKTCDLNLKLRWSKVFIDQSNYSAALTYFFLFLLKVSEHMSHKLILSALVTTFADI